MTALALTLLLAGLQPEAAPPSVDAYLDTREPKARESLWSELMAGDHEELAHELLAALDRRWPGPNYWVADRLAAIGDVARHASYRRLSTGPDRSPAAAFACCQFCKSNVTPDELGILLKRLGGNDQDTVTSIIIALARADEKALPRLIELMHGEDPILARRAAVLVGQLRDYPRIPFGIIHDALQDPIDEVARRALQRLPEPLTGDAARLVLQGLDPERSAGVVGPMLRKLRNAQIDDAELAEELVARVGGPPTSSDPMAWATPQAVASLAETLESAGSIPLTKMLEWAQKKGGMGHQIAHQVLGSLLVLGPHARDAAPAVVTWISRMPPPGRIDLAVDALIAMGPLEEPSAIERLTAIYDATKHRERREMLVAALLSATDGAEPWRTRTFAALRDPKHEPSTRDLMAAVRATLLDDPALPSVLADTLRTAWATQLTAPLAANFPDLAPAMAEAVRAHPDSYDCVIALARMRVGTPDEAAAMTAVAELPSGALIAGFRNATGVTEPQAAALVEALRTRRNSNELHSALLSLAAHSPTALLPQLAHESKTVRRLIHDAVRREISSSKPAARRLAELLLEPRCRHPEQLLATLGACDGPELLGAELIPALVRWRDRCRLETSMRLRELGPAAVPVLLGELENHPDATFLSLRRMGSRAASAVSELTELAARPGRFVGQAQECLAFMGPRGTAALESLDIPAGQLVEVYGDAIRESSDPAVIGACARALLLHPDEALRVVKRLRPGSIKDSTARAWCAVVAARVGGEDEATLDALIDALATPKAKVRRLVVQALGNREQMREKVVSALRLSRNDPDATVRSAVERALEQLGTR